MSIFFLESDLKFMFLFCQDDAEIRNRFRLLKNLVVQLKPSTQKKLSSKNKMAAFVFFVCLVCPFGYLYLQFFFNVIASIIAYIHPVYGAGVQTHDYLIMSHLA
jgi:hypothetical protein